MTLPVTPKNGPPTVTTETHTTSTATTTSATQDVVQVYRDAGAIGVALISLVIITLILSVLLFRVLKMYTDLSASASTNENLRIQTYSSLATQVGATATEVRTLSDKIIGLAQTGASTSESNSRKLDDLGNKISDISHRLDRNGG